MHNLIKLAKLIRPWPLDVVHILEVVLLLDEVDALWLPKVL